MSAAVYAALGELETCSMIEPIMYFGIGFLAALLIALFVIPHIHGRAVRLTMQRLEASLPLSMAEIQADKDQLRAEFAMTTRRFEINAEQLKNRIANQLAELGKKGDAINRLKIELGEKTANILALEARNETLRDQLRSTEDEIAAKTGATHDARALSDKQAELETVSELDGQSRFAASPLPPQTDYRSDRDSVPLVPNEWPTAELAKLPTVPSHSLPPDDLYHRSNAIAYLLMKSPAAEEIRSTGLLTGPDAGHGPADWRIEIAGEQSNFSAGLKTVEPPIRALPSDQFAGDKPSNKKRMSPTLIRFFIAVLIGVGALYGWHYHGGEAKKVVKTWILSLGGLSFMSTRQSPVDADVAMSQTSASSAGQAASHDAAAQPVPAARSAEQPTAKEEELARIITTLPTSELHIKQKMTSPPGAKLTPTPETRPTTIEGWTLLEVADDSVVLKGPNGVWRATRGDTVPGAGRVMSVVLWGNRWIVATTKGLISTP